MEWISVKDRLPEIPEGKYGVQVLVAQFDPCYEELNPGHGYSVRCKNYGSIYDRDGKILPAFDGFESKFEFMELYLGGKSHYEWGPCLEEVTHWMPLPDPPKGIPT